MVEGDEVDEADDELADPFVLQLMHLFDRLLVSPGIHFPTMLNIKK